MQVRNVNMKAYAVSAAALTAGLIGFVWFMTLPEGDANEALPMPEYHADNSRNMPKFDAPRKEPQPEPTPPPAASNPPPRVEAKPVRQVARNNGSAKRTERKEMPSFGFGESDMSERATGNVPDGIVPASTGGASKSREEASEPGIPGYRQKRDFLKGERTSAIVSNPYRRAVSEYFLKSGTLIPAKVMFPASTDQPGSVFAQVTVDIKDSVTGECVLIPAMSTLVGDTNDQVAYGQSRGQAKWIRVEFPEDGGYQDLGSMAATDARGQPGYDGRVDHHYGSMAMAVAGAGVLSAMQALPRMLAGDPGDVTIGMVGAGGSVNAAGSVADEIIRRELDRQNEITIEPEDDITLVTTRIIPLPPQGDCE